jgi:hypothetical protein
MDQDQLTALIIGVTVLGCGISIVIWNGCRKQRDIDSDLEDLV